MTDQVEFATSTQEPLHVLAGFKADGGGEGQGHGHKEANGSALATKGLDFDGIFHLHEYRLLYKVANVKGDSNNEPTQVTRATDVFGQ